jgi:hypothetical protein
MSEIKEGYLRVSQVLSAFSGLDKINKDVLQNAANRGTCVHSAIDSIIAGFGILGIEDEVRAYSYCENAIEWHDKFVKELDIVMNLIKSFEIWNKEKGPFKKPERLYDDELKITGEFDLIEDDRGVLTLIDFKTPVAESKTWKLQASGYHILGMSNGIEFDILEFVKLCRKGNKPKSFFYDPNPELFKSVLETYRYFELEGCKDIELDYL